MVRKRIASGACNARATYASRRMWPRGTLLTLAACGVFAAPAAAVPPTFGPGGCYDPTQANADFEAYGPTDVNVQAGNGRVTVNENPAGTITVFKYPDPSLFNLVKYFTKKREANGVVTVQHPNEGSFAGIRYVTRGGKPGFAWLKDWRTTQRYESPDTPVPVTTYRSPRRLGLGVTNVDVAPPGTSRFVRQFWVRRGPDSPVRSASLVYFANFNPTASHVPLLPIGDWCTIADTDGAASYDAGRHAIVNSWSGADEATGEQRSIAVAFGFAAHDSAHQVGGDAYDDYRLPAQPPDAYDQAPDGLGGADSATGQTDGALEQRLRFGHRGLTEARVTIAGGADSSAALAALDKGRRVPLGRQLAAERRDWRQFLRPRPLPAAGGARVREVAKRSLITLRLARAAKSGAIVASVNTQGPYGEDWIRDGAFINSVLDRIGLGKWVTKHNLFYARVQASTENPSPLRPPGNWAMNSYSDGVDGAPIPWEIDETGLGAWTLWDHFRHVRGAAAKRYLAAVYPAIGRAADFLTTCEDPTNGLQCTANEDDSYTPSQTLHGAGPVYLGLRSAVAAARAMGDGSARVAGWRARLGRLRAAIAALYDPKTRSYRPGTNAGNAYNVVYGDGGWLLWPVRFKPYADPTMRGEARVVWRAMRRSLRAPQGQYEAKALLGLSHAWKPFSPRHRRRLRRAIRYMARALATPTGLFGESWKHLPNGRLIPVQDMPHVWEHTLWYMAALRIEGSARYRFAGPGFVARACARGAAPASACRR